MKVNIKFWYLCPIRDKIPKCVDFQKNQESINVYETESKMKTTLMKILTHNGHGSRKEVIKMIQSLRVSIDSVTQTDPKSLVDPSSFEYEIDGKKFKHHEFLYVALNKPAGYECSHSPNHHQSVFELLPAEYNKRKLQSCGRLDVDTTGLLLFTDDGKFNQQLMSPKKKVSKTYLVTLCYKVTDSFLLSISGDVLMKSEEKPVKALSVKKISEFQIELSLTEGKYHQVKRMVAACSNRVEALQRTAIGNLKLSDIDQKEGDFISLPKELYQSCFN